MSTARTGDAPLPLPSEMSDRPPPVGRGGLLVLVTAVALIAVDHRHSARWAELLLATLVATVAHLGGIAAAGGAFGLGPERVTLFFGGALLRCWAVGCWWSVGWIPLGGTVKFTGSNTAATGNRTWGTIGWAARVTVALAGPVALAALALALLGRQRLTGEVRAAGPAVVALARRGASRPLATAFVRLLDGHRVPGVVGTVAVVWTIVNLLPAPVCNGGQAIVLAAEGLTGRRIPQRLQVATSLPFVVAILLAAAWFVADLTAVWGT